MTALYAAPPWLDHVALGAMLLPALAYAVYVLIVVLEGDGRRLDQ